MKKNLVDLFFSITFASQQYHPEGQKLVRIRRRVVRVRAERCFRLTRNILP